MKTFLFVGPKMRFIDIKSFGEIYSSCYLHTFIITTFVLQQEDHFFRVAIIRSRKVYENQESSAL